MTAPTFDSTYAQFITELKLTFPEFESALTLAESLPGAVDRFTEVWRPRVSAVATKSSDVFKNGVELVPGFVMTAKLWSELSTTTHDAIWKYISTLLLLAAQKTDSGFFDISGFSADMEKLMEMLKNGGGAGGLGDLFANLSKMAETFGFKDMSGSNFKIPERMFKGHIARIAQELVAELKPEDFGIDPELLKTDDPKAVFTFLQEIMTSKPELLMSIAQKIANKLKGKFQRGEIKRDEIIAEAEELMKEFSENAAFTEMFKGLREAMMGQEKESGNDGSARRREVQERLRKKAAERAGRRETPMANTMASSEEEARAAAAAAALLMELDAEDAKKGKDTKARKGRKN
jgi:hypothetical protein